jgi:hypothetical protein
MLPSLTIPARHVDRRRLALGVASALLAVAALASAQATSTAAVPQTTLSDELHPATWAMFVPTGWLAAPAPRARRGDLLDLFAMKTGDRGYAAPIAYGAAVVQSDDRGLLLEIDEDDAAAIASARASGMQLVALLRSTR